MAAIMEKGAAPVYEDQEATIGQLLQRIRNSITYLESLRPSVHFHVTTAYNILRHNGVELGKKDFLGP